MSDRVQEDREFAKRTIAAFAIAAGIGQIPDAAVNEALDAVAPLPRMLRVVRQDGLGRPSYRYNPALGYEYESLSGEWRPCQNVDRRAADNVDFWNRVIALKLAPYVGDSVPEVSKTYTCEDIVSKVEEIIDTTWPVVYHSSTSRNDAKRLIREALTHVFGGTDNG